MRAKEILNNQQDVAENQLKEDVGGNYLYYSVESSDDAKLILSSGFIEASSGAQTATRQQTKLPVVSVSRSIYYAVSGANVERDYQVVFVLDRNAIESRYKTFGTSQHEPTKSDDIFWNANSANYKKFQKYSKIDTNRDGKMSDQELDAYYAIPGNTTAFDERPNAVMAQIQNKQYATLFSKYNRSKSGKEFEEVIPVKGGQLPLKGILVGFYLVPNKAAAKDQELLNNPMRLAMPRPNTFVKATQQNVVEDSLEEIDRRGFLRGMGAAAATAAGPGMAQTIPDWQKKANIALQKGPAQKWPGYDEDDGKWPAAKNAPAGSLIAYRGDTRTGKLETLPTLIRKETVAQFLNAYKLCRDNKLLPSISPETWAALLLVEGRSDFGYNGPDILKKYSVTPAKQSNLTNVSYTANQNNVNDKFGPKMDVNLNMTPIRQGLKKLGISENDWRADFCELLSLKIDTARRLGIPFYQAWNGGTQFLNRYRLQMQAIKDPKNKPLMDFIRGILGGGQGVAKGSTTAASGKLNEVFNTQPSNSATWARPIGHWDDMDEFNFIASNGVAYRVDFLAPVVGPDELGPESFFKPEEEISDQAYESARFVSFEQKSDDENTVGPQGIEGTGVAAEVFGIVTNVILQYIKKAKPSMLYFQAVEPNRQRLYARMAARLAQTIGWKVKQDGPGHFAIYNPRVIDTQGVAEAAVPGSVTFAGKDPNEFKSPKGGKPVMVIQTEQGSRYLITSDGMVLRHKSVHANTGGEDAGLKDWSDKIEFYDRSKPLIAGGMQPLSFPDAVAHLADQGRIALSTGKSGARVAVILDNGNWRPATIADAMPKAAAAKPEWAKIVIKADAGTWGSQPKLGWQPLDYNQRGDGTLNRVHNGSPVSHGAKVAQGVAEAAQNDLSTIIQSFVASPAGQKYKQHDCKTVTRAFVAWAEQNKITTQVVSLAPPSAEFIAKNPRYKGKSGQGDGHIMPIVNGNAIDFTVRQFGVGRPFENPLITPTNSLPAVYGKFGYFTDKPEWFLGGKSHWIGSLNSIPSEIFNQNFGDELLEQGVAEAWSEKYKKSINCKNPRGFSQRAHCQGRKKNNEQVELDERKRKRKKKTARYYYGPAYYFGATDTGAEGGDGGELEEDWKKSLANVGLAGAIGLGAAGGLELKDKIKSAFTKPTAQTTQPVQAKSQQVQVSPITNNPLETYLMNVAKKSGLTGIELAQFLGQCAHETMDYKRMIERGAKKYFNKYEPKFAPGKAKLLGNVKSGDGERYKGRGYIQLTGRYNYKMAGRALNLPLEQNPELAAQPEIAAQIALWYWGQRVKPEVQDFADTTSVTRKINPGLSGLEDRHENFLSYMAQRDD